jgi:hypothetical protein
MIRDGARLRLRSIAPVMAGLGLLVLVVAALSRLTACEPPALPTTETGEGRTGELDDALARLADAPLVPGLNPWRSPPGDAPVHTPETYDWDFTTLSRHAGASIPSHSDQSWSAILVDHHDSPSPTIYAYTLACC